MRFLYIWLLVLCSAASAKEKQVVQPYFTNSFGEVCQVTVEFVDKPNTYYHQNIVKAQWLAKVVSVNGKPIKKSVTIEYRCDDKLRFKKGKKYKLMAYEDIKTFGVNREWDGKIRQVNYGLIHFMHIRLLTDIEKKGGKIPMDRNFPSNVK